MSVILDIHHVRESQEAGRRPRSSNTCGDPRGDLGGCVAFRLDGAARIHIYIGFFGELIVDTVALSLSLPRTHTLSLAFSLLDTQKCYTPFPPPSLLSTRHSHPHTVSALDEMTSQN